MKRAAFLDRGSQEKVDMSSNREERIRQRAHAMWEKEGRPHGAHDRHWQQATSEVDGEDAAAAGEPAAAKKSPAKAKASATAAAPAKAAKPAAAKAEQPAAAKAEKPAAKPRKTAAKG